MLHEEEFKPIMSLYWQLWKEGVIFPIWDINSSTFIKFNGRVSPIFETIENQKIYEEPRKIINPHCIYSVKETDFIKDDI